MKLLTKKTDYAVRAILTLSENKDCFLSARYISGAQNLPYHFLRGILQELIKHKIVVSREGAGGGFKLRKDPHSIGVVDIIKIFQGNIQLTECIFRKRLCQNRKVCALRKEIKRIESIVDKEFKGISIGKLLDSNQKNNRR
jgi:Rrf2 family transcriptional regulator, cysteine metabolism repressor